MGLKVQHQYTPNYSGHNHTDNEPDNEKEEHSGNSATDGDNSKQKNKPNPSGMFSFFKDPRVKGVIGVVLILTAALLLISCLSYLLHGKADQSLVENHGILENAKSDGIQNSGGPFGAAIAEQLINKGFGVGAFFIIYLVGIFGWKLLTPKSGIRLVSTTLICLVSTITVSSLTGLLTLDSQFFFPPGGYHGRYLNEFLISVAGIYGAIFVNIALISILIALCLNTLKRIYKRYSDFRAARRKAEQEAMRREEEESRHTFGGTADKTAEPKTDTAEPKPVADLNIEFTEEDPIEEIIPEQKEAVSQEPAAAQEKQPSPTSSVTVIKSDDEINMTVTVNEIEQADDVAEKPFDPTAELSKYKFPPLDLLVDKQVNGKNVDIKEQEENKERITKTLGDYGIPIRSIEVCVGPTITLYEIIPAEGVRIAKIKRLEDDIALSLAALGIRIIAPIPGKGTIGIEVPNKDPQTVYMRPIINSRKFQECKYELPIALGSTISNDVYIADLTKMPHVLVAGATGQGKSVGLNAIITSLLYKKHPSELKFVMIDPKMVEFNPYARLERHYIAKLPDEEDVIVTNMSKAVATLNSLVGEMENRYTLLKDAAVRNIKEYNAKFIERRLNPEKGHKFLPYIVVVVDEFADLIMFAGKEVETPIARIAQKARAVGIHIILATQRPSTNVITGIIKANFPARIAFRVTAMVDSRTILDRTGAQQLIGKGDMLISDNGNLTRVQCAFVDTPEVEEITKYIESQIGFSHAYDLPEYTPESTEATAGNGSFGSVSDRDPLFEEAATYIVASGQTASTSSLQRRYSIGYNRAGKIMDQMEAAGIVGPSQGGKPRQVLIDSFQLSQMLNNN